MEKICTFTGYYRPIEVYMDNAYAEVVEGVIWQSDTHTHNFQLDRSTGKMRSQSLRNIGSDSWSKWGSDQKLADEIMKELGRYYPEEE